MYMKKVLITMTMLLALTTGAEAAAQKHRHTPQDQQELVDSVNKDAVEVYSDTTSAAQPAGSSQQAADDNWPLDDDDDDVRALSMLDHVLTGVDGKDIVGMLFVLGILFILFVLSPVLIIIALFYFINKNRKQKMKLAQMAMQQGQPIPEQLLENKTAAESPDDEFQKGMRQCFVGVGLMIFLGYAAGNVGFGVGALVFCIGLGKVFASKTTRRRDTTNGRMNDDGGWANEQ